MKNFIHSESEIRIYRISCNSKLARWMVARYMTAYLFNKNIAFNFKDCKITYKKGINQKAFKIKSTKSNAKS